MSPTSGDVVGGRYRLDEPLGHGGMARVWRGVDTVLGRPVAVKILHLHLRDDDAFTARFRHEAVTAARVSHPNIVAVYDTISDEDIDAIVLELVEGVTLRQHLDDIGALEPHEVTEMGVDLARALVAAHKVGLIHRDIKPANILIGFDGSVKIADFGIARAAADTDLTEQGAVMGTASYLSPEQLEGKSLDGRSDLYSLGLVLFEAASGRTPFPGDDATSRAMARLSVEPLRVRDVMEDVPADLDETIDLLLRRDRDQRIPDAATLLGRLERVRDHERLDDDDPLPRPDRQRARRIEDTAPQPHAATPGPRTVKAARPARARRRVRTGTVLLSGLVGGSLVLLWLLTRPGGEPSQPGSAPTAPPAALTIVNAVAHDPEGTGTKGENDELAKSVIDGDPSTSWRTEGYNARTYGTKRGVGIFVELARPATIHRVDVTSPTRDWSVELYVTDEGTPPDPVPDTPQATQQGIDGNASVPVEATGRGVLIWITDLGAGSPPFRFQMDEVAVIGTPRG